MKKIFVATVALAVMAIFISSAQAINVSKASVKKGVVAVKGSAAAANSQILWEGGSVATANKKGGFSFSGVVPADCVGKLSDGVTTINVAVANCTPTGAVLETGQTACYDSAGMEVNCAGTGQDGDVRKGRTRSYAVDINGLTITDNTTGLEWEKLTNDSTIHDFDNVYTWAQAFQKIADLNTANFAGQNDWRLPNINELQTLTDYGRFLPAIDTVFRTGNDGTHDSFTQLSRYWSSTSYRISQDIAWGVYIVDGAVFPLGKSTGNYVRAVRGGS